MKIPEIIAEARDNLENSAPSVARILKLINQGTEEIAAGILLFDGSITPPLVELRSTGDVSAVTNPYVALPATYQRGLYFCSSSVEGGEIGIFDSFIKFMEKYPLLDKTGDVDDVVVYGLNLYYQPLPSSTETLKLYFFRKPVDRSLTTIVSGDTISFSGNVIADSGSGFTGVVGDSMVVVGSDYNDMAVTLTAIDGGGANVTVSESLTTEAAGQTITIYKCNDAPDGIPVQLARSLLVNYVCRRVYESVEKGIKSKRVNTNYFGEMFNAAVLNLRTFNGPEDKAPRYTDDESDYIK